MKTHNRHLIILVTLAAIMLGLENWGWGQEKADPVPWPGSGQQLNNGVVTLTVRDNGSFTATWPSPSTVYDYIDFTNDNWNANTGGTGRTVTFTFKFTTGKEDPVKVKLIDFRGASAVGGGGGHGLKLVLEHDIPSGVSRTKPTLQRYDNNGGHLIPISRLGPSTKTAWLVIQGTESNDFIIDGGCNGLDITTSDNDYSVAHGSGGIEANGCLLYSPFGGTIELRYVTFQNNYNSNDDWNTQYGALCFANTTTNSEIRALDLTMDHVTVKDCYSVEEGAAVFLNIKYDLPYNSSHLYSSVTMQNCTIEHCFAYGNTMGKGGIFRTHANTHDMPITATNCTFRNNYNRWVGGAITWWSSADLTLQGCTFENNHATYCSGAIEAENLVLKNCIIQNNTVYYHSEFNQVNNHGGAVFVKKSLKVSGLTKIKDNTLSGNYSPTHSAKNVYFYTDSDQYVTIDTEGLDCGSSIGVSSNNVTSDKVATGTAANCQSAYRNHCFFDDAGTKNVYLLSSDQTNLYFQSDWGSQANVSGVVRDGDGFVTQINNAGGLAYFAKDVNSGKNYSGHTVVLNSDINLAGNSWCPIGNKGDCVDAPATCAFAGTFDGQGHTISGLTTNISNAVYYNLGLFGYSTGTITNTFVTSGTLTNASAAYINTTNNYIGGLVGINGGIISNCGAACTLNGGNGTVMGGLVGLMEGGTVQYCIGSGTLTHPSTISSNSGKNLSGGLVGQMTSGTIHSCSAMAILDGYTMGGIVGVLGEGCALYNSYANPQFTYRGNNSNLYYVGGLVASNTGSASSSVSPAVSGIVQNCYVRFSRASTNLLSTFGRLAGRATNNALSSCYRPTGTISSVPDIDVSSGASYNCYQYNTTVTAPYLYSHTVDFTLTSDASKNLLDELNRWVGSSSTYSKWKRTRAGGYIPGQDINGDYPIHKYDDYHCVASTDGITLHYATTLDNMLTSHNTDGTTINLYTADAVDGSGNNAHTTTASGVVVYVDEDVCVLPEAGTDVRANTCQTLRTYASSRWHDVSSSLQDSKIGFTYGLDGQPFSWLPNPCSVTLASDDNESLFPTDLGDLTRCDLYCFYEPEYHWLNLKRNSNSHWHMNATTEPINYIGNGTGSDGNEDHLVPGKGYLVSVDKDQLLENEGILNRGNVTLHNVTKTNFNAWAERLGFNLLGNPYQSYLDFEEFITENGSNLWDDGSEVSEYNNTFAIFDPSLNSYVQYKNGTSYGSYGATQFIHPHQGFFIRMTKGSNSTNTTTVTYTNAMRSLEGDGGEFRGEERPAYPLINFLVRDSEGNGDVAVLELSRGNVEGASKMHLGECTGKISLGYEGEEYGILFRTEVLDYQPLHFKAGETGTFTLEWNTANGTFEALTLIDNIAGTTTDMLAHDSYSFEGNPDQYSARFKVVVGDYKGIDEPEEDGPSTGSGTFAFQMGDQLVVNGEGELQIIDMLGRVVMTDQLTGSQSTTNLPKTAGVYVLRLTNTNGTRTQKMVIR